MTKMEDDQNGRPPKWKTTKMEDDQNGRRMYNLVGAFLGLATMLRGDSLFARVDSQCAEKIVKMCRTCVGCVGMTTKMEVDKNGR